MFKTRARAGEQQTLLRAALAALAFLLSAERSADSAEACKLFLQYTEGMTLEPKKLQTALEVTRLLVVALFSAEPQDPLQRQALLGSALVRYLDSVTKGYSEQRTYMRTLCKQKGLPVEVLDIRHRIAHSDWPSAATLRLGALACLQHVFTRHWAAVLAREPPAEAPTPPFCQALEALLAPPLHLEAKRGELLALAAEGEFELERVLQLLLATPAPSAQRVNALGAQALTPANFSATVALELLRSGAGTRPRRVQALVARLAEQVLDGGAPRALGWLVALRADLILESVVNSTLESLRPKLYKTIVASAVQRPAALTHDQTLPVWFNSLC